MLPFVRFVVKHCVIRMYLNAQFVESGSVKKMEFLAKVAREFTAKNTHCQNAKSVAYSFAMIAI
jgi:hypothetical protein